MPQHRTQRHALLSLGVAFAAANLAVGILYPLAPVLLTGRGGLTEREWEPYPPLAQSEALPLEAWSAPKILSRVERKGL